MNKMLKFFLVTSLVSFLGAVFADEGVESSEIIRITSLPNQCGGDSFIQLNPALPSCPYAYVKSSDPSSEKTYSLLLAAYMSGKKVGVYVATGANADNNSCISGSSVCKILSVTLKN